MIILIGLIVSIAFFILCFLSTENILSSIIISIITFAYFAVIANSKIKKKKVKITRFHECYQFINNFFIALSIKGHLSGALSSALESQSEDTIDMIKSLNKLDAMDKLQYLKKYFCFNVYYLFLDIINLYNDQGGNIIQMSHYLSNQIREDEDYIVNAERMHKDIMIEFVILWIFSLAILGILKFSLSDFFKYIVGSTFFQISVVAIFVFVLFSINLAITKICDIEIKGWNNDEK